MLTFTVGYALIAGLFVALHLQSLELGYQTLCELQARIDFDPVCGKRGIELLEHNMLAAHRLSFGVY
jgi:hypothetical protein